MKNAFTLIEMLIALAVSSLVAMGLFSMFSSVAEVRGKSVEKSESIVIIQAVTKLINRDARMMTGGTLAVDSSDKNKKLKLSTQNSLRFNKAVPVDIVYYIDDYGWLVRRETNTELLFDMEMRLIPNASDLEFEFYDGNEYKDKAQNSTKMFKVHLNISGSPITVLAGRTFENS